MDKKNRILVTMLIMGMTFSSFPSFGATLKDFSDSTQISDANREGMSYAVEKGFLVGYKNKLEPNKTLTRAELASVLTRVYDSAEADISQFSDLAKNAWYYSALAKAYKQGFIKGKGTNKMAPHDKLTAEEAYAILVRLSSIEGDNSLDLSEYNVSPWAKGSASILLSNQIISKEDLIQAKHKKAVTRGEFVTLLHNVLKNSKDKEKERR